MSAPTGPPPPYRPPSGSPDTKPSGKRKQKLKNVSNTQETPATQGANAKAKMLASQQLAQNRLARNPSLRAALERGRPSASDAAQPSTSRGAPPAYSDKRTSSDKTITKLKYDISLCDEHIAECDEKITTFLGQELSLNMRIQLAKFEADFLSTPQALARLQSLMATRASIAAGLNQARSARNNYDALKQSLKNQLDSLDIASQSMTDTSSIASGTTSSAASISSTSSLDSLTSFDDLELSTSVTSAKLGLKQITKMQKEITLDLSVCQQKIDGYKGILNDELGRLSLLHYHIREAQNRNDRYELDRLLAARRDLLPLIDFHERVLLNLENDRQVLQAQLNSLADHELMLVQEEQRPAKPLKKEPPTPPDDDSGSGPIFWV